MGSVRVAIVGVGNCASSLVQGVEYYKDADPADFVPGLMHVQFGDYHVRDVEFVAAFDVDGKKVGLDLRRGDPGLGEQHPEVRRRPPDRHHRAARAHARRPRQVLPRDDHRVRCRAGRRRRRAQGRPGRHRGLLPARQFRGCGEVLRPVRDRRRLRLRQRAPRLHRRHPGVGAEVHRRRTAHRRRRHQEPGWRNHHAPRHGEAVRGPRCHPGPDLPAERRREHGLQERVERDRLESKKI